MSVRLHGEFWKKLKNVSRTLPEGTFAQSPDLKCTWSYLLAQRSAPAALGLLVGLGQCSIAGTQALAGGIIHLPAPSPLHVAIRQPWHSMRELFVPEKWLELGVQLRKLPGRRWNHNWQTNKKKSSWPKSKYFPSGKNCQIWMWHG